MKNNLNLECDHSNKECIYDNVLYFDNMIQITENYKCLDCNIIGIIVYYKPNNIIWNFQETIL